MIEIPLTQGKVALVDNEDAYLAKVKWCASFHHLTWYVRRRVAREDGRPSTQMLHRAVLGLTDPRVVVDHINGDGLDNQRENLRVVSTSQNIAKARLRMTNTSGFRGVTWDSPRQRWVAQIKVDYARKFLGRYYAAEDAARAYDAAARQHFGEFARLNFPEVA